MKVLNLRCEHDHAFEGWFGSAEDFESQSGRGLVACPMCGSTAIIKGLSAPRLNLGAGRGPEALPAAAPTETPEARWLQAVRALMAKTEDVGERFTEEARRMHYGETQERGIRGQASAEQTVALLEEGIAVMPLPMPPGFKGSLQ
jgi:hypothetical protein